MRRGRRLQKVSLRSWALACALGAVAGGTSQAEAHPPRSFESPAGEASMRAGWARPLPVALRARDEGEDPVYVPGQVVVKYRSSVRECVHCVLKSGKQIRSVTHDGDSLARLHAKYGVRSARPVFRTEADEARLAGPATSELQRAERARVEAVARRFPARAVRAPEHVTVPDLSHVYVLEIAPGADAAAAAREFAKDSHVEYSHPNFLAHTQFAPNDPYYDSSGTWGQAYGDLWGLDRIQMGQAWDLSRGAGALVAVIDSGLDVTHEDIFENVWANPAEVGGNGVDDDANGFVDDLNGWDFTTCAAFDFVGECVTPKSPGPDPRDDWGHGTHVAGIVAAVGDNSVGVIGVAPEAQVMPVKGLNGQGLGTSVDLAAAIRYAADNGADVLNNSWRGLRANDLIADVVAYAYGMGSVIVAAAGNDYARPVQGVFPAGLPNVIVVTALSPSEEAPFFANRGITVDLVAPGVDVLSLRASGTDLSGDGSRIVGERYLRLDGTSMAAPHAAGMAALIVAGHPAFTNEDVRQVIRGSAQDFYRPDDLASRPGWDVNTGHGVAQAFDALNIDSIPTAHITSPERGAILVNVDHVDILGTVGGTGFAGYRVEATRMAAGSSWTEVHTEAQPVSDGLLARWDTTSLPDGNYYVQVIATGAGTCPS